MSELAILEHLVAVLRARLGAVPKDESGVTDTVIMIGIGAVLALTVGAIITAKLIAKANSIPVN